MRKKKDITPNVRVISGFCTSNTYASFSMGGISTEAQWKEYTQSISDFPDYPKPNKNEVIDIVMRGEHEIVLKSASKTRSNIHIEYGFSNNKAPNGSKAFVITIRPKSNKCISSYETPSSPFKSKPKCKL